MNKHQHSIPPSTTPTVPIMKPEENKENTAGHIFPPGLITTTTETETRRSPDFNIKDMKGSSIEYPPNQLLKDMSKSPLYREIAQLCILTFFAILGSLARMGIVALTSYDGSYVGGIAWANFTACIIVGFCIKSSSSWAFNGINKGRTQLYIGITTGFCGTFSSFCSLILEVFERSANITDNGYYSYPNPAYGIMNGLAVLIVQVCLSAAGIRLGKSLARAYDPDFGSVAIIERILAIIGALSWIAVICLISIKSWRSWIFACIVTPLACFMRFYIGKWLNPKFKDFPMGTFFVNIFATVVLAALTISNRGKASWMPNGRIVSSELTCQMITGLENGFCATLSTIATMFVELHLMKDPKNFIYGGTTFILAYCLLVVFLGSYNWTQGLTSPVCS